MTFDEVRTALLDYWPEVDGGLRAAGLRDAKVDLFDHGNTIGLAASVNTPGQLHESKPWRTHAVRAKIWPQGSLTRPEHVRAAMDRAAGDLIGWFQEKGLIE